MFVYSPESKESLGGLRLIRKADIHLGNIFGIIISIILLLLLLMAIQCLQKNDTAHIFNSNFSYSIFLFILMI